MIVEQTKVWIKDYVIKNNFCPFAAKVYLEDRIYYRVVESENLEDCLAAVNEEFLRLDSVEASEIDTTLIIFTKAFQDFTDYLEALNLADELLVNLEYESIYQLASFHPNYQFAGEEKDDPSNFTNRSPYPIIHILREDSVSEVIENFDDPISIPQRNIKYAREKGLDYFVEALREIKL